MRWDYNPEDRIVKQEHVEVDGMKLFVSTADLGIDCNIFGAAPLYFETMVFDWTEGESYKDVYCDRYTTREEADRGHKLVVEKLKNEQYTIGEYGYFEFG